MEGKNKKEKKREIEKNRRLVHHLVNKGESGRWDRRSRAMGKNPAVLSWQGSPTDPIGCRFTCCQLAQPNQKCITSVIYLFSLALLFLFKPTPLLDTRGSDRVKYSDRRPVAVASIFYRRPPRIRATSGFSSSFPPHPWWII